MIESKRKRLLFVVRWLALSQIIALYFYGFDMGSFILFAAIVFYNVLLNIKWDKIAASSKLLYSVIYLDLIVAASSIYLTGGSWKSPNKIYAFTSLMFVGSYFSFVAALVAVTFYCLLYTTVIFEGNLTERLHMFYKDIDTFLGNYAAFFLIATFFGYPSYVIRQISERKDQMATIEQCLEPAQTLIKTFSETQKLSEREHEVLSLMLDGKTHAQI
ncbi:MAG: hypothetical protein HY779_02450, partial [Rubrobacteridae bacterium]|nr:hypothetical protein [Rubrobacteridae bacterium]